MIKAISLGAGNASLFAQLGYLNMQLDSPMSAVAAYQQALMLAPQDSNIKQGLLFALIRSKQFVPAKSLLEQILADKPNDAALWLQRANLAIESKDQHTAIASMEVAMRLGDDNPSTKQLAAQVHLKLHNYPRALVLLEELIDTAQLAMPAFQTLMNWLIREKSGNMLSHSLLAYKKVPLHTNSHTLVTTEANCCIIRAC
ncbi:tetratricopeptide repeat protein [Paraglaciecola aquimarina]|uniref:Tetratricopeptide repeat protein n=1 Tax=Paraglaciecola aquimarina TaxID=1235557 RepID=A0ABU3T0F3_9ALTE|nr:tetratricopeptide repeat protein [Paraglaciecola aquimarina]MDU0355662.1 tetratricopeptide repeat protein [Paraglaciecola aquimarina]